MYNKATKTWSAPPPEYACIQTSTNGATTTNLKEYIRMTEPQFGLLRGRQELRKLAKDNRYGVTMTLTELEDFFDAS